LVTKLDSLKSKNVPIQWTKRFLKWPYILAVGAFLSLVFLGPLLVVQDEPRAADAIIVIGGDHKPERMQRAVELYQQGLAPTVIISAGTLVLEGDETMPEAEVMRRQALALGLPEEAIILETDSLSTFGNAYYSKQIVQERGWAPHLP
jgi:uncharacterized SAM-binding protein YcdF (DUF218 family)